MGANDAASARIRLFELRDEPVDSPCDDDEFHFRAFRNEQADPVDDDIIDAQLIAGLDEFKGEFHRLAFRTALQYGGHLAAAAAEFPFAFDEEALAGLLANFSA